MDAAIQRDSVLEVAINRHVMSINGFECDEIIFVCRSGVQKRYNNSVLTIDIGSFNEHLLGNWHKLLKLSKALPLRSIIDAPSCLIESSAIEIKPKRLSDSVFKVPVEIEFQ